MSKVNVSKLIGSSKMNSFFALVAILAFLGLLFDGYDQGVYGNSLPALMKDTGIAPTVFGLIGSYTLYGMMAGGIIFGMLADRIGNKKVFMLAIGFYAVFTGMMGTATEVWQLSLYRVLTGMGIAGIAPVTFALVAEYSPLKNRVNLISATTLGVPLGTMFSALVGKAIIPEYGWRPMFLLGFIPIVLIFICAAYLPESMQKLIKDGKRDQIQKLLKKSAPEHTPGADEQYEVDIKPSERGSFLSLWKDGMAVNTILYWVIMALCMFIVYGLITWLPKILMGAGYNLGSSLTLMITFTLGAIPGILISGPISNKIGLKNTLIVYSVIPALVVLLLMLKLNITLVSVVLFILGAGMYGLMGLIYVFVSVGYPLAFRGTGLGWSSAMGRFGGSFAPIIGGMLIAQKASLMTNFLIFATAPFLLIMICVVVSQLTAKKATAPSINS
ncbi:hypothetical protein A7K50_09660 [Dehalobacter sp. MCB1]|uniref:MFS transporter n=1 Tax=unclassified Dehalobacter TaxID=2635733 RepID=UPI000E6B7505|nr:MULTISPECIES: MFS transporter [unclassified Dehalobacter]RJE48509.1 hypothetical protein A7K50_09660 [Dehalobacter sp. MCB1]TCX54828.1 MFS transporter [Dehalobacter sp. 12DCB1]